MLALRDAAAALGTWRLTGATLVVTLEPCPMCAGAALAARVDRIVFGAADPKAGATGSLYNLAVDERLNHTCAVVHGVRADASAALLETSSPNVDPADLRPTAGFGCRSAGPGLRIGTQSGNEPGKDSVGAPRRQPIQ